MTDYYPGQSTTTHDTTALPRFDASQPGVPGAPPVDEAGYWAQRYQQERRRSRTLTVAVVAAVVVAAGVGISALRSSDSAAPVAAQAPVATSPLAPGATPQEGATAPEGSPGPGGVDPLPQGQAPGDGQAVPDQPGSTSPQLPEPLRQLGSALGITDVDDLIDLAVANDLISAEQAEQLRAAVTLGTAAGRALGGGDQDA